MTVLRNISGFKMKEVTEACEDDTMTKFIICTLAKYHLLYQRKENEIDRVGDTSEGEEKCFRLWSENLKEDITWKT
jgi:hypothetical protein